MIYPNGEISLIILKLIPKEVKESGINNIMWQLKSNQQDDRLKYTLPSPPLNINGLNLPIKRQRFSECRKEQDLIVCCPGEMYFRHRDKYKVKIKYV